MANIFFLITLNFDGAEKEMRGLAGLRNENLCRGPSAEVTVSRSQLRVRRDPTASRRL